MRLTLLAACSLLVACTTEPAQQDAGLRLDALAATDVPTVDGSSAFDALAGDAFLVRDAAGDAGADGGEMGDAWSAPAVFSTMGSCGVLDTELTDMAPHWVENVATFPEGWTLDRATELSAGAQQILAEGTAGGSSGYSEAFAFEMLHRCEGAGLVASETMIRYSVPMPGSITDILVEIDGLKIGVSVSRAVTVTGRCMRGDTYAMAEATRVLTQKLNGIRESSMLVAPEDRWVKQILFIYADTAAHAATLRTAWDALDPAIRADSVLYVSVSEEMDGFIYFQTSCP